MSVGNGGIGRLQREKLEQLVAAAAEQQRQWHEQRSQWEAQWTQLAEEQRQWDGQRRRLEEAAAARAAPDSECAQCDLLRKQVQKRTRGPSKCSLPSKLDIALPRRCVGSLKALLVPPPESCVFCVSDARRDVCGVRS